MRFVKLTTPDGRALWINPAKVKYIFGSTAFQGVRTIVHFTKNDFQHVKESPDEVLALLEGEPRPALDLASVRDVVADLATLIDTADAGWNATGIWDFNCETLRAIRARLVAALEGGM